MIVYVVMKHITYTFENDACWDDGYYDDYYETEVNSEEFIGIYATEEEAKKAVETEDERYSGYMDHAYYFAYEIQDTIEEK